jgi:hypothetical protein
MVGGLQRVGEWTFAGTRSNGEVAPIPAIRRTEIEPDLDKSKSFYQSLFSWQLQEMDMGGGMSYTTINVEVACFRVPPQ